MMFFVTIAQPPENLHCLSGRGRIHHHRLEASFQGGVALGGQDAGTHDDDLGSRVLALPDIARQVEPEWVAVYAMGGLDKDTGYTSLEQAAETMCEHGFRHLLVISGSELCGVLSMRDIVRCWVQDGATSELPKDYQTTR